MDKYYINRNPQWNSRDNEVHKERCVEIRDSKNLEYLGRFVTCHGALEEAKSRGYSDADGCATCSFACHNG